MKWFLQLADLSSQFSARHFSSNSLHALLFFPSSSYFPPSLLLLSSSLNFSNTLSLSLFCTLSLPLSHSLHLLFFDLLAPSVLSLTALHRHHGWKEEISEKLHEALRGWWRNSPSHTQQKGVKIRLNILKKKRINCQTLADYALEGCFHCCGLNMLHSW